MGSSTSKMAPRHSDTGRLSPDSRYKYGLLPNQNKRNGIKSENSSDDFDSSYYNTNECFSDQDDIPISAQNQTSTSCGPEDIDTWELIEGLEGENTTELIDKSELSHSSSETSEISQSSSETSSYDVSPQLNIYAKNEFPLNCRDNFQILGTVRARVNSFERKIAERRMKRLSLSSQSELSHSCLGTEISTSEISSNDVSPQLNIYANNEFSSDCCDNYQIPAGIVRAKVNSFERKVVERRMKRLFLSSPYPSEKKKKIVFYFTSCMEIPRIYVNCQYIKKILQGYGVCLHERDVSMDGQFQEELNELVGTSYARELPMIFVDGCYIGGAEEVMELYTDGELGYLLQGCEEVVEDENFVERCPICDDVKFLPCWNCLLNDQVYFQSREEGKNIFSYHQLCENCWGYGLTSCGYCR